MLLSDKSARENNAAILYEAGHATEAILYRREIAEEYNGVVIAEKKKKLSKQLSQLAQYGVTTAITLENKKIIKIDE